jgi:hypothetical protein
MLHNVIIFLLIFLVYLSTDFEIPFKKLLKQQKIMIHSKTVDDSTYIKLRLPSYDGNMSKFRNFTFSYPMTMTTLQSTSLKNGRYDGK